MWEMTAHPRQGTPDDEYRSASALRHHLSTTIPDVGHRCVRDRDRNRELMQRKAENDACEADQGADREVDAARQDDEGHADRDDAGHNGLVKQVEQIVGLEEMRREQRERDRYDDRQRKHAQFEWR